MTETILESAEVIAHGTTWRRHIFSIPESLLNRQIHLLSVTVNGLNFDDYEAYLSLVSNGQLNIDHMSIHKLSLIGDDMNVLQFFKNPIYLTLATYNITILVYNKSNPDEWSIPSLTLEWMDTEVTPQLYFCLKEYSSFSGTCVTVFDKIIIVCDHEIDQDSLSFQTMDDYEYISIEFLSPCAIQFNNNNVEYSSIVSCHYGNNKSTWTAISIREFFHGDELFS